MTLKEFWESDILMYAKCVSEKESIEFCAESTKLGFTWCDGAELYSKWDNSKVIYYTNKGKYSKSDYSDCNLNIIMFNEIKGIKKVEVYMEF